MKNQHFFLLISLLPGGFLSKMTLFSLSTRVHALWMCYNEQSLYLYLKTTKKKTAQGYRKPSKGQVQLNLVCNQFDVALTSMYTKVLTEWDETKRLPNVGKGTCHSILLSLLFRHHLSPSGNFLSVFLWGSFAPDGICMTGLKGFRLYPSPDANTTFRPPRLITTMLVGLRIWDLTSGRKVCKVLSQHRPVLQPLTRKTLFTSLTVVF